MRIRATETSSSRKASEVKRGNLCVEQCRIGDERSSGAIFRFWAKKKSRVSC